MRLSKKISGLGSLLFLVVVSSFVVSCHFTNNTHAINGSQARSQLVRFGFLGFKKWSAGVSDPVTGELLDIDEFASSVPEIRKETNQTKKREKALTAYVWQLIINILDIVLMAIGYITFGFILYGGFQFITSMGSSDKMAQARTTILNASVGTVIAMASVAIVRTFSDKLFIASATPQLVLDGLLDIFYFAVGATAVVVIIISGFTMVTSGDKPDSVAKARNSIIYASIGLVVIVSAKLITSFILGRF